MPHAALPPTVCAPHSSQWSRLPVSRSFRTGTQVGWSTEPPWPSMTYGAAGTWRLLPKATPNQSKKPALAPGCLPHEGQGEREELVSGAHRPPWTSLADPSLRNPSLIKYRMPAYHSLEGMGVLVTDQIRGKRRPKETGATVYGVACDYNNYLFYQSTEECLSL